MKICFTTVTRYQALTGCLGGCLVFVAALGCQSWLPSSALSGLTATQGERLVVKQAKNDPFPSPSDVGIQEQNNE